MVVGDVGIGAEAEKEPRHLEVLLRDGNVQSRVPTGILGVDIAAIGSEGYDETHVALGLPLPIFTYPMGIKM